MSMTSDDILDEFHLWMRDVFSPELDLRYSRRPNSQHTMDEITKFATEECYKRGYVVRVHTSECLLGIGPVNIDLIDTTPDHEVRKYGNDSEKKQYEVRRSVERNEEARLREFLKSIEK